MPPTMRLVSRFQGSVPKHDDVDAGNDDSFVADVTSQRFAVSDGASESYDPGRWSQILCEAWAVSDGRLSAGDLDQSISRYDQGCDIGSLSWSRRAAFDRGSYATLVGVELRGSDLRVVAFGDSMVVHHALNGDTASFPYTAADEFDSRPLLLSTNPGANGMIRRRAVPRHRAVWHRGMAVGDVVLVMTDALGHWLLRQGLASDALARLERLETRDDLLSLVRSERATGEMRRDDTTLLHLRAETE